ncbi:MAG TPA: glycosyltransferase family 4 protein [Gemmatimonadales bacterium]|nr:glycosyltransferase family 4 protein [Gemmatimonadales bacterium]
MIEPLRIAHVVAPGPVGGLERVVCALALGHRRCGHAVRVVATLGEHEPEVPFLAELRDGGVEVTTLRLPGRAYADERRAALARCREFGAQVVHTHGYRSDVVVASAAGRAGMTTLSTAHGFTGGGWKNRLYEWLQVRAFRRLDAVVAVSRPMVERLVRAGVPRERIRLLPNAWAGGAPCLPRAEARRLLGAPEDRWLIGWVGRLSREKGADVLLEALAHLRDLPLQVSIVGEGREGPGLRRRTEALGLSTLVRWHGTMPDAARLFTGFDLFVLSSRTEGTPIVLFEAMAAGVPVVTTRVGGVPDVVSDGEAALVPPDDPAALAAAIRAVWHDPDAAGARAAAASARLVAEYAAEPWLARYEALYRELMAARKGGTGW